MPKAKPASAYDYLINESFGKLTVIMIMPSIDKSRRGVGRKALCKCICGNYISPQILSLTNCRTRSCGCTTNRQTKERYDKLKVKREMHGMRSINSIMYTRWSNIKNRCLNKDTSDYKYYGARGITICDKWKNSFLTFYEDVLTEIGPQPSNKSLDRIDNNKNYQPGNIRWATQQEQVANSRKCLQVDSTTHTATFKRL